MSGVRTGPNDLTGRRVALGLEYDGSRFYGFQRQRQQPTVQQVLEAAIARVADHAVTVHCAGRTDTGVHAFGQVVHFDSAAERDERAWVLGINSHLPDGVSVLWARGVEEPFHARFSARARSYRYRILNRWVRPGIEAGRVAWERRVLDAQRMHEAAQVLVGEHDFSSFRADGCQARGPNRCVHSVAVWRDGDEVCMEIRANAFLYHMVRNIIGTLIEVGAGKRRPEWVGEVLAARSRVEAGPTAPATGLYFLSVSYPDFPMIPTAGAAAFPRGWNLSG
ncbi:MAG: tRNA pseudouridine(38-40) synthase TruA [Wenzhouxiangellaceae bacterium]|nr:tRNA pseudouridine(38-40) synthase TruA [Wenzhouxiangellaceae bacterium]